MSDILDKVYFDNPLRDYLMIAGIILLVVLFKRYIAQYLAAFIFLLLRQRYKTIDRTSFRKLVIKPLGFFIVVLISLIALDKLQYPSILDFSMYHLEVKDLLRMIGTALLIISFFRLVIRCIEFFGLMIKERYLQSGDAGSHQLFFFFKDFLKVIIALIGGFMILKYSFGYDIKGMVTGLSIVGAAVALALKESLENLIASFIIFFDKPFKTGDLVKVNNFSGTVEKIGLRSTRIRTDAKTYITVPNKQMVDSVLDNLTNRTQRRSDLKLEIHGTTSSQKVQELLRGIKEILRKPEIQDFSIFLSDISATALVITGEYFTEPLSLAQHNQTREKVNFEILQLFDALQIEIAGKVTDVKIVKSLS